MINLKFSIENQILTRIGNQVLVNKSRNHFKCFFDFLTPEWRNIEKFAIFKDENDVAYIIHLGKDCQCQCLMPNEVLTGNFVRVTVYGDNLITSTEKTLVLLDSGYTDDISLPNSGDADIFNEVFAKLNSKIDDVIFSDGLLLIYSNDELIKSVDLAQENLVDSLAEIVSNDIDNKMQEVSDEINNNVNENINDFLESLTDEIKLL